jgi:hypothetical protein
MLDYTLLSRRLKIRDETWAIYRKRTISKWNKYLLEEHKKGKR